jgi:enamine deaminase RidA (YjgF/YER057c/UK114 family)
VFVSGQVATDADGKLVGEGDPVAQAHQVFANLKIALEAAGATLDDVAKLTWYVIGDQSELRPVLAEARRSVFGDRELASTLLGVAALASPEYLFEAEAIAVVD